MGPPALTADAVIPLEVLVLIRVLVSVPEEYRPPKAQEDGGGLSNQL